MRRILVLNQFALPREQSGGTRHIDLFTRLKGWEPIIVAGNRNYTTQKPFRTTDARFRLVPIPSYTGADVARVLGWGLYAAQAAAVGLAAPRVDAVYASSPNMLTPLAGWLVARARRAPLTVEIRDLWPESIIGAGALRRGSRLHRALVGLERWIYHHADHLVTVTPGWEQHFADLGISLDRLSVVPNGTELEDFNCAEPREALRTEFELDRVTAVYAGAHGPANGLDMLIEAARDVTDVDLLLIGSGSQKERLREAAAGLSNVRFLDPMPKHELARVLAAADIGVHCIEPLPILTTGMSPNKLFDYMAAGLPTVSNAGEGLRTVLVDGEAGRTGGPEDLPELIAAVAAADPEQRRTWGLRGRQIVADRFSRTAAAERLRELLQNDLQQGGIVRTERPQVAHLTTAHRATDNRIFRKECTALHEAGVDVHLIATHDGDTSIDGIPVHALPKRSNRLSRMLLGPVDAMRKAHRVHPQVLHIHDPELIPAGLLWKAMRRGKLIFDAHEDLPKQVMGKPYLPRWARRSVSWFARGLELAADRSCDAIVAATPAIARNFSNPRTIQIQNFPWLRDFPESAPYSEAAPRSFSYVGGLSAARGAGQMLEAVDSLSPSSTLTVAGPVTPDVESDVQNSSATEYLGIRPAEDVPGIVRDAQVGLVLFQPLPNHVECQPTKLFEYMAACRPFIASDFEYWQDLLGAHDCGLFVDPTDSATIAAAAEKLLSDTGLAAEMGLRGRAAVESTFNFEVEGARLVELVRALAPQ